MKKITELVIVIMLVADSASSQDQGLYLFFDAVTKIYQHSLYIEEGTVIDELVRSALQTYIKTFDKYAEYLAPEEYSLFLEFQKRQYVGVGMEIYRTDKGAFVCSPLAGGPAERAGICAGDELTSVNGISVQDRSLLKVAMMIKGDEGSAVNFNLLRQGTTIELEVIRTELKNETIELQTLKGFTVLSIKNFNPGTKRELKSLLKSSLIEAVIFDLRGNPGGDLHSAIDAAMLFLDEGISIVTVQTKAEKTTYCSTTPQEYDFPIYLLQDQWTASAAEVFTAALVQNKRAISFGVKTYGKGTTQKIIPLVDDSALVLTNGLLLTPQGGRYDGIGLEPMVQIGDANKSKADYCVEIKKHLKEEKRQNRTEARNQTGEGKTSVEPELIIVFKQVFENRQEAEIRAAAISESMDDDQKLYLIEIDHGGRLAYQISFGTFTDQAAAQAMLKKLQALFDDELTIEHIASGIRSGRR